MNLGNTLEHLAILRTLGSNPKDLNDFERWQIVVPKINWEPPPPSLPGMGYIFPSHV